MSRTFDALSRAEPLSPDPESIEEVAKVYRYDSEDRTAKQVVSIDRTPPLESHILTASEQSHPVREHFRYLEHQLRRLSQSMRMKRLLVTSPAPQEGKTVVAANLATTLACSAPRVLLIDADMRASGRDVFGLADHCGLADALEERAEPAEVMIYLDALKVYYIPSGKPSASPVDLLQGKAMRRLLETVEDFDWIIVDSPPLGAFADALALAAQTDGIVLVARAGLTSRQELEQSLRSLNQHHIVGVVLNACDQGRKDYYYSYYDAT